MVNVSFSGMNGHDGDMNDRDNDGQSPTDSACTMADWIY